MFQRFICVVGGLVLIVGFVLLVHDMGKVDGLWANANNGYNDTWKLQFLYLARMAMFPTLGVGLFLFGVGVKTWGLRIIYVGLLCLVLSIISMVIAGTR